MSCHSDLYEVVEQECICDGVRYTGYGIKMNSVAEEEIIYDVSTDKRRITEFVSMLNDCRLDVCQFHDAVEDFLSTP